MFLGTNIWSMSNYSAGNITNFRFNGYGGSIIESDNFFDKEIIFL